MIAISCISDLMAVRSLPNFPHETENAFFEIIPRPRLHSCDSAYKDSALCCASTTAPYHDNNSDVIEY